MPQLNPNPARSGQVRSGQVRSGCGVRILNSQIALPDLNHTPRRMDRNSIRQRGADAAEAGAEGISRFLRCKTQWTGSSPPLRPYEWRLPGADFLQHIGGRFAALHGVQNDLPLAVFVLADACGLCRFGARSDRLRLFWRFVKTESGSRSCRSFARRAKIFSLRLARGYPVDVAQASPSALVVGHPEQLVSIQGDSGGPGR